MVIKGYKMEQGSICFLAGLSDIFRYLGVEIAEEQILAECSSLAFCYGYVDKCHKDQWCKKWKNSDIYFYGTDFWHEFSTYEAWAKKIGMSILQVFNNNEDIAMENMEYQLNKKIPVLTEVDTYYLPYHVNYKKKHDAHTVVVYGIDYSKRKAFVADNYITTLIKSNFKGEIPYDAFINAVNLKDTLTDYSYIHWNVKRDKSIYMSLAVGVNQLKESIIKAEYEMLKKCSIDGKRYFGIEGIRQMQKDILCYCDRKYDEEIGRQLNNIHACITGYGGPIPTRMLYLSFLQNQKYKVMIKNIDNVMEDIIESVKQWRIVANVITKSLFCQNTVVLKKVVERISLLIKSEEKIIIDLTKHSIDGNW